MSPWTRPELTRGCFYSHFLVPVFIGIVTGIVREGRGSKERMNGEKKRVRMRIIARERDRKRKGERGKRKEERGKRIER